MSRIWGILVGVCAIVGVTTILYVTIGHKNARVETAKEKALKWLDSQLGEADVAKKDIAIQMQEVKAARTKIQGARIEAEVRSKNMKEQMDKVDKQIADGKTAMAVLSDKLAGDATKVSLGGKDYDKAEVKDKLTLVIKAHKALTTKKETMQETYTTLSETAKTLKERETQVTEKIAQLDAALERVAAKVKAIEAQKVATQALSDTDDTLADKIAKIEKNVNDLDVKMTVAKGVEDEKWKAAANKTDLADVNSIIDSTKDDRAILDEVNAILKDKK